MGIYTRFRPRRYGSSRTFGGGRGGSFSDFAPSNILPVAAGGVVGAPGSPGAMPTGTSFGPAPTAPSYSGAPTYVAPTRTPFSSTAGGIAGAGRPNPDYGLQPDEHAVGANDVDLVHRTQLGPDGRPHDATFVVLKGTTTIVGQLADGATKIPDGWTGVTSPRQTYGGIPASQFLPATGTQLGPKAGPLVPVGQPSALPVAPAPAAPGAGAGPGAAPPGGGRGGPGVPAGAPVAGTPAPVFPGGAQSPDARDRNAQPPGSGTPGSDFQPPLAGRENAGVPTPPSSAPPPGGAPVGAPAPDAGVPGFAAPSAPPASAAPAGGLDDSVRQAIIAQLPHMSPEQLDVALQHLSASPSTVDSNGNVIPAAPPASSQSPDAQERNEPAAPAPVAPPTMDLNGNPIAGGGGPPAEAPIAPNPESLGVQTGPSQDTGALAGGGMGATGIDVESGGFPSAPTPEDLGVFAPAESAADPSWQAQGQ